LVAATQVGLQLTLLPVLYCYSDFGGAAPQSGQRRFIHPVDDYCSLLVALREAVESGQAARLGIAFHSLRAVDERSMRQVLDAVVQSAINGPIHIHVAEQLKEVEACLAWSGQRPVRWLLDRFAVDARWCLVHATHLDGDELQQLARCGAVAGLCPTTEANLGDGIFPATTYQQQGGCWAVGSDSQVAVDLAAELRLLEYGQRLAQRRRGMLGCHQTPAVGEAMYRRAALAGARALGIGGGEIRVGSRADFIVLDEQDPVLVGRQDAELLNAWVFAAQRPVVRDVMVAGQWRLRDGRHEREEEILADYREVVRTWR